MKITLASLALTNAINIKGDIYGQNGAGHSTYINNDAGFDLSQIGVDITNKGNGTSCIVGG